MITQILQAEKELGRSIVSNQNFLLGSELDTSEPQLPFDTEFNY